MESPGRLELTSFLFDVPLAPEAQPRHTPLGGLRRLGTVMNRRKSIIGPPTGSFDKKAEKKRSPFASFKRSDSAREMQIPESPPETMVDRPGTSMTEDEFARNPSVAQDRIAAETVTPVPVSQPEQIATNGASPEAQAGLVANDTHQVCALENFEDVLLTCFLAACRFGWFH